MTTSIGGAVPSGSSSAPIVRTTEPELLLPYECPCQSWRLCVPASMLKNMYPPLILSALMGPSGQSKLSVKGGSALAPAVDRAWEEATTIGDVIVGWQIGSIFCAVAGETAIKPLRNTAADAETNLCIERSSNLRRQFCLAYSVGLAI